MTQPDIFDENAPWAEDLPELRQLLEAYSALLHHERFTDTPDSPSKAMRSYLRIATFYPGRAFRATAEILHILERGLDAPEVVSEMSTMAPLVAPAGRTREDCLMMMIPHLVAFTEAGEQAVVGEPETLWEWQERLPNLRALLGSYYHQDAGYEHHNADGTLDNEAILVDYFTTNPHEEAAAAVSEIGELFAMGTGEAFLNKASSNLGVGVAPPHGLSHEEWLSAIARDLRQRLDAAGYQPPPPPNPAYPTHDKRAWER